MPLNTLLLPWRPHRRLDKEGRLWPLRPRACRMTEQTTPPRPLTLVGGNYWVPQGGNAGQEAMQVDVGAPLEVMLARDEINEALNALHRRTVSLIEIDMDNEAEGVEPDIEAEPLLEEADHISVASSAPEFHECLPATDEDAARLGFVSAFAPEPENGPVGRGLQDDAEIEEDLDPAVLESLDEAVAALALVPDRAAAKEVLSLHDLSHFTLLPTSYPWGDVGSGTCSRAGFPLSAAPGRS